MQFDPPDSVESYIHRAGRACRGVSQKKGIGILFLTETETGFVELLRQMNLTIDEIEFPTKKIINVQQEMEDVVGKNYNLAVNAQAAFRDCCLAYANHSLKKVFDIDKLDLMKLGRSFGLRQIPRVDCVLGRQKKAFRDRIKAREREERKRLGLKPGK